MNLENRSNKKCIGLLSGGLDSTLAVSIMYELGMEITLLNFLSPFCNCTGKNAGCKSEAVKVAKRFSIPIKVESFGAEYLEMVRNPRYGYGKNMNPCLDCRIMMFGRAKVIMKEIGASFLFTGEVLGQRPMSQRRDTIYRIEREAGLQGLILRPLSAKLLPPTIPEQSGIIDREQLLSICGRSRKPQIILAEQYNINDYPCPSGGCLLTEINFSTRVKDLLRYDKTASIHDAKLLRVGRHFRISDTCKAIVGRNEEENHSLDRMVRTGDYLFTAINVKGPLVVGRGEIDTVAVEKVSRITARYASVQKDNDVTISYQKSGDDTIRSEIVVRALDEESLQEIII